MAKKDIVKKGSVYDTDSRKGRLTIRLEEDVNLKEDTFFQATILEGTAKYASIANRLEQRASGMGTPGDTISFRTSLWHFIRRRPELEVK